MKIRRTAWISTNNPPIRRGWYEVMDKDSSLNHNDSRECGTIVKRYWDGLHWKWQQPWSKERTVLSLASVEGHWRGVKQ